MRLLAVLFFILNVMGAAINFYFFFEVGEIYSLVVAAFNVAVAMTLFTVLDSA